MGFFRDSKKHRQSLLLLYLHHPAHRDSDSGRNGDGFFQYPGLLLSIHLVDDVALTQLPSDMCSSDTELLRAIKKVIELPVSSWNEKIQSCRR